jgi:hypothetical protein
MDLWELLAVVRRQRVITAIGALVTIIAVVMVMRTPGVYSIQGNLLLLPPTPEGQANVLQARSSSLIGLAGVIDRRLNEATSRERSVSESVTLVGEGVTHGYSVRLPNKGGQWNFYYDRPLLDVQVAGRSEAEVEDMFASTVALVDAELQEQQAALGVPAESMVRTQLSPPDPPIRYGTGSKLRALLITLVLGAGMTIAAVIVIDGLTIRNGRTGRFLRRLQIPLLRRRSRTL